MQLKGAITVLNKETEFLGITFDEVIAFIENMPLAVPVRVRIAYEVYIKKTS